MDEQTIMGAGDRVGDDAGLARLLPALSKRIATVRLRIPGDTESGWAAHHVASAAELLVAERERLTARVAELESDLDDLHTRYAETMVAFDDAAPDALRALHKRQVDARSLDATLGAEMAEKVRAALRKKPVAAKGGA